MSNDNPHAYTPADRGATNEADPTAWQRPAQQGSSSQQPPPGAQQAWGAPPPQSHEQPWGAQQPPHAQQQPWGAQQPGNQQQHLAQTPWHLSPEKRLNDLRDDAQLAAIIGGGSWFVGLPFIGGPIGLYMAQKVKREFIEMGVAPTTSANVAWWIGLLTTIFALILPIITVMVALVLLLIGVLSL
jgi:hypothetical protein